LDDGQPLWKEASMQGATGMDEETPMSCGRLPAEQYLAFPSSDGDWSGREVDRRSCGRQLGALVGDDFAIAHWVFRHHAVVVDLATDSAEEASGGAKRHRRCV